MAAFVSFFDTLTKIGIGKEWITPMISLMPGAELGFSWLVPSAIGIIVGSLLWKRRA